MLFVLNPRVSIALATFNGAAFLDAQLESLNRQTYLPHEIVVADDGSSDDTMAMLHRYLTMMPIRIIATDGGHGPTRNFERAMRACHGDIVMCCDQDDVWHPYKIERMIREFDDTTTVVFCDANLVDAELRPLNNTLWKRLKFDASEFNVIDHLGNRTIAFGLTMAYRNSEQMRDLIFPIPMPFGHDNFVALIGAAVGCVALVPIPLLDYRQHSGQVSGSMGKRSPVQQSITPTAESFELFIQRLHGTELSPVGHQLVKAINHKSRHLRQREILKRSSQLRRFRGVVKMAGAGDYHRYSNGLRSVIRDLFF